MCGNKTTQQNKKNDNDLKKKGIQLNSSISKTFCNLKISFFLFGKNTRHIVFAKIFTEATTSKSYSEMSHKRKKILLTLFHFLLYI